MKLQPNFSWQKYEGAPEDSKEQFQFQLQQEHIGVANAINATIDDLSYFTRDRQTGFRWIDNTPIYTKTIATSAWTMVGTLNTISLGITGDFSIINMVCYISDGAVSASNTLMIPNIDFATPANNLSIQRAATDVIINSGGTDFSAWSGYLMIYYIKPR